MPNPPAALTAAARAPPATKPIGANMTGCSTPSCCVRLVEIAIAFAPIFGVPHVLNNQAFLTIACFIASVVL
jgi:hypothetical protein